MGGTGSGPTHQCTYRCAGVYFWYIREKKTLAEVGRLFGISRQRVHQIVKRHGWTR